MKLIWLFYRRLQDSKSERKDFIYYILKQSEHYDLSQDEVIVNAALFMYVPLSPNESSKMNAKTDSIFHSVAGSETTASTLASLTNNLLRHPEVYNKLKHEIRSTFKTESDIKLQVVNDLPYLNACIEEGLRIFPPAPIGFLRSIQAGGDVIDGHHLPGGVSNPLSA